jgi:hypothetical protein
MWEIEKDVLDRSISIHTSKTAYNNLVGISY